MKMRRLMLATTLILSLAASALAGGGLMDGRADFKAVDAEEEGYWYSRYNLGNLVMRSGLGLRFKPPKAAVMAMMKAVDANPNDGDSPAVRRGIVLLRAVYKSGDPHYTGKLDPKDFGTQHWDPAGFEKVVTASASGWTIMKEAEWAKQFHVDEHFGTPSSDFGAQWRFVGMIMNASAKVQAGYAASRLMNEEGLVLSSDGSVDWLGQWVMLESFSNLSAYLGGETLPHSSSNRYYDPGAAKAFGEAADRLYSALTHRQPQGPRELSQAVQALTWYIAARPQKDSAKGRLRSIALQLSNAGGDSAAQRAYQLRGLIEAWRVSKDDFFRRVALRSYAKLLDDYNFAHGMFRHDNSHSIDDVAAIMGAINASRIFLKNDIEQTKVEQFFTNFYESAVNRSGLQQSAPPLAVAKGEFEQHEPALYYAYPDLPKPPMAGGRYGIAPVFASRIVWDAAKNRFRVADDRFDSAGAMHASNEFIWFHNDEVNGFPMVR